MAYYDYYRQRNPSLWGRPEYTFDSPPAPRYQPQPQWRGYDYYSAHFGGSPDPSVFDNIWGRVRSHFKSPISRHDAQLWHRRVYGGQVDVSTMMPAEIGSAAGYEAWRFWEHHRGIYRQPLMEDRERETEALVGLAVGEAEKLWDYTRRRGDKYGKREALETAAAVAMKLFRKGGDAYAAGGVPYEQPYLAQGSRYPRHRAHRRRSSSVSPLEYGDDLRGGYSSSDRDSSDFDRYPGRSPAMTSAYLGSPSVASAALPIGGGYDRRRANSFYGTRPHLGASPYIPPLDTSALSTSPGAIIIPPPPGSMHGHHHASSFGGAYGPSYGAPYGASYGTSYEYRDHNGMKVHRTVQGDPSSEYSHLPPGTYMIEGGSSSRHRKHRSSHSGRYR